jgi:alginate O-acetyltransferase complex protein AlgI
MPFNTPLFVFLFGPLVIATHYWLPARWRIGFIVGASVLFYGWGEPRFVAVVLLSSLIDYGLAAWIARTPPGRSRQALLVVGVGANLGLLVYCKYANFFLENLEAVVGSLGLPRPDILIPLGISFIVFEKITYLVDVYRGTTAPARSLTDYLAFVFLFPKLLAGPILKFHELKDQIERHRVTLDDLEAGLFRFMLGLSKKVLIADHVAEIADRIFAAPTGQLGLTDAWLGALAFTVQIYFDFSAYSDMAIGLARALGFRLKENFDQPYLSVGFGEFWRRWHISLSTWIRDYLYVPLGGNRGVPARTALNLWICFLASGLWHGANWTFVAWGAFHGLFVFADRLGFRDAIGRLGRPLAVLATFLLVVLGWVLFRATSLEQAFAVMAAMADPFRPSSLGYTPPADSLFFLGLGLVLSFIPLQPVVEAARRLFGQQAAPMAQAALLALVVWPLGRLLSATFTPFIYFRF